MPASWRLVGSVPNATEPVKASFGAFGGKLLGVPLPSGRCRRYRIAAEPNMGRIVGRRLSATAGVLPGGCPRPMVVVGCLPPQWFRRIALRLNVRDSFPQIPTFSAKRSFCRFHLVAAAVAHVEASLIFPEERTSTEIRAIDSNSIDTGTDIATRLVGDCAIVKTEAADCMNAHGARPQTSSRRHDVGRGIRGVRIPAGRIRAGRILCMWRCSSDWADCRFDDCRRCCQTLRKSMHGSADHLDMRRCRRIFHPVSDSGRTASTSSIPDEEALAMPYWIRKPPCEW